MTEKLLVRKNWGSILNSTLNRVAFVLLVVFMAGFAVLFTAVLVIGSAWELTEGYVLRCLYRVRAQ